MPILKLTHLLRSRLSGRAELARHLCDQKAESQQFGQLPRCSTSLVYLHGAAVVLASGQPLIRIESRGAIDYSSCDFYFMLSGLDQPYGFKPFFVTSSALSWAIKRPVMCVH